MSHGLDIPIENLRTVLANKLFTGSNYIPYGRAYWNGRRGETIPEVYNYAGNRDYMDVLLDDTQDGISFFLPEPEYESTTYLGYNANVGLYFAVNLRALYPTETVRPVERFHEDVLKVIQLGGFQVTEIVSGWRAFDQFGYTTAQKDDMSPFYLCKFTLEIQFIYNKC